MHDRADDGDRCAARLAEFGRCGKPPATMVCPELFARAAIP